MQSRGFFRGAREQVDAGTAPQRSAPPRNAVLGNAEQRFFEGRENRPTNARLGRAPQGIALLGNAEQNFF